MSKQEKAQRVLSIFYKLLRGQAVSRQQQANSSNRSTRTFDRDIEEIQCFLADEIPGIELEFDRAKGTYALPRDMEIWLSMEEILAIAKIMLASRSLNKEEIKLLNKLTRLCDPDDEKVVREAIGDEMHHYTPVSHDKALLRSLWDLNDAIRRSLLVELTYTKATENMPVQRIIEPVALLFSDYYFYLIANIVGTAYPVPTVYRLDRIQGYTVTDRHFRAQYGRFSEGEFRKRIQFMQKGDLMTLRIRVKLPALEATLDRLPTARVISQSGDVYMVEAEVYGGGIKMWLLSQGTNVEVVSPQDFRDAMRNEIAAMGDMY
ncbi:MAG: WYL domain-containing protein [Firmicutes bacterium]|nr:WYL domain-containing protein [Bacillota bacterium]